MSLLLRLALSFLVAAAMATAAHAERRIALVIGNSAYSAVSPLANPKNDAALMARTLKSVGFEVTMLVDADQRAMKQAMLDFGRKLRDGADASLFYYSGHGVQANGENYLIPVDAAIKDQGELDLQTINVNAFLQVMDNASSKVNIIILDACRNNPFASSLRSATRGLTMLNAPTGTYIAYSTGIDQVAEDGTKGNSPFTQALARAIVKPGVKLEDTFKEVRRIVEAATNKKQVPWDSSSITGDFYFRPPAATPPQQKVASIPPAVPPPPGTYEVNHNRAGMDYKSFDLTGLDPRLCQQACQSDGQCRAWTFVSPRGLGVNARCWLKNGVPSATPNNCCTSGAKSPIPPAQSPVVQAGVPPSSGPGSPDEAAWLKVASSADPADFGRFLQAFPTSRFAANAKARQASLTADQQRKLATASPAGANAAAQGSANSPDEAAWQKVASSADPADFSRFLQAFPTSRFAANAKARQASLSADQQRKITVVPDAGNDATAQSGVFVLLGHWASRQIALDSFKATQQRFPDILGDKQTNIKEETADQGRTLYRNRIGPFSDVAQARSFCARLQAAGGFCFVPGNGVVVAGIQPEQPAGPAIHATGKLQVSQSDMFDLDRGAVVQAGADVWFEVVSPDQLFLVPQNGAELAPFDPSKRDFNGCASQTYSANALSLHDLPPGSLVCVKTRQARIGRLTIDGLSATSPRTLALDYTVWEMARQ